MSSGITAIPGRQAVDAAAPVGGRGQAQASTNVAAPAKAATALQLSPNPTMRIDSALAMVVIEFHGPDGKIENSIPTAQQLDAYRRSQGADHAGAVHVAAAQPAVPSAPSGERPGAEDRPAAATPLVA